MRNLQTHNAPDRLEDPSRAREDVALPVNVSAPFAGRKVLTTGVIPARSRELLHESDVAANVPAAPLVVIWSNKHSMWWAPNCEGYARSLRDAGVYSEADAREIVRNSQCDPAPGMDSVALTLEEARHCESISRTRPGSVGEYIDSAGYFDVRVNG
jgi:hypothetical protein